MTIRSAAGPALAAGLLARSVAHAEDAKAPPKPDPGTTAQSQCLDSRADFTHRGKGYAFAVELTNKCEQRLKCRVFISVMNAKGTAHGHRTLVLAAKSDGGEATKDYEIRVQEPGGMAQVSRECRAL